MKSLNYSQLFLILLSIITPAILAAREIAKSLESAAATEHAQRIRLPARLVSGYGRVEFPITCRQSITQSYFNQAVAFVHCLDSREADRSFFHAVQIESDCAMAWWGLAIANIENPLLANYYIKKAAEFQASCSRTEKCWIKAVADYLESGAIEETRRLQFVNDLDRMSSDSPEDPNVAAFLVRQLLLNRDAGIPIRFNSALDALMERILVVQPSHPILHYRLLLSGQQHPQRVVESAELALRHLPASPKPLTAGGHVYSRLGRNHDALKFYEASLTAAQARIESDRVSPEDVPGYLENVEQLVVHLSRVGRLREAIALSQQLIEFPTVVAAPSKGKITVEMSQMRTGASIDSVSPAVIGQRLLLEIGLEFQLWDQLLSAEKANYFSSTSFDIETRRRHAVGLAHFVRKNSVDVTLQLQLLRESLQRRLKKQDRHGGSASEVEREKRDQMLLLELELCDQISRGEVAQAVERFQSVDSISPCLSVFYQQVGDAQSAELAARRVLEQDPMALAPQIRLIRCLWDSGQRESAITQAGLIAKCFPQWDSSLLLPELKLPTRFEVNSDLRSAWKFPVASGFQLPNRNGEFVKLNGFHGRPVVLVFYRGAGCPHCIEQLRTFAPLQRRYEEAGVQVIAISTDSVQGLQETFKVAGAGEAIPFVLVSDEKLVTFREFGAFDSRTNQALHGTFLIDAQGRTVWRNISFEPFMATTELLAEIIRITSLTEKWRKSPSL